MTDNELLGAHNTTNDSHVYGFLGYDLAFTDKWIIRPEIGCGFTYTDTGGTFTSNNPMGGFSVRGGLTVRYQVFKRISFHASVQYLENKYNVDTRPDYKAFYSESKLLEIGGGIEIRLTR